jgi:hypothetical protein
MAFETQSSAPRAKDTAGAIQEIKTFSENADGSGEQIQAVALTGIGGAKAGVPGLPLHVQGTVLNAIDTNAGATDDAAITTDAAGTLSGKLRGLVAILADVWDSVSHFLRVSIQNATLAVTQSGVWSVTANAGTNLNTSALALEVGGNLASIKTNTDKIPVLPAIAANQQPAATTPTSYNVTMTLANTEYSQALPANTKRVCLQCRGLYDVRFAFVTGKVAGPVAPYHTLLAGMNYWEDNLSLAATTIYVACGVAAQVAELVCWS